MSAKTYVFLVGFTGGALLGNAHAGTEYLSPKYRPDPQTAQVLANVRPGHDGFPLEKTAEEIGDRLNELGDRLRAGTGTTDVTARFLTMDFSGLPIRPRREVGTSKSDELVIFRGE